MYFDEVGTDQDFQRIVTFVTCIQETSMISSTVKMPKFHEDSGYQKILAKANGEKAEWLAWSFFG